MLNKLSVQGTFTASLPLPVLLLAGAVAAGMLDRGRSQADVERIHRNELLGLSAVTAAAPGRERVFATLGRRGCARPGQRGFVTMTQRQDNKRRYRTRRFVQGLALFGADRLRPVRRRGVS